MCNVMEKCMWHVCLDKSKIQNIPSRILVYSFKKHMTLLCVFMYALKNSRGIYIKQYLFICAVISI